jgi:hypothetical protein
LFLVAGNMEADMALGNRGSNKTFLPVLKYDARSGEFALIDRVQSGGGWDAVSTPIKLKDFRGIPALDVLEVGWIDFPTGKPPDAVMVAAGNDAASRWGDPPADGYKLGIRLIWKMPEILGGGIRELLGTSIGLWHGVDQLHDDYMLEAKQHPGELPIATITSVQESGGRNVSYTPVFKIIGWKSRPPELPDTPPTAQNFRLLHLRRGRVGTAVAGHVTAPGYPACPIAGPLHGRRRHDGIQRRADRYGDAGAAT